MSDGSFDATRRRQARLGLGMTPAERLRWLEDTRAAMLRWRGRARSAASASGRTSSGSPLDRLPVPGEEVAVGALVEPLEDLE
jgi:hypothetical protein